MMTVNADILERVACNSVHDWVDFRNFALAVPPSARMCLFSKGTLTAWLKRYMDATNAEGVAVSSMWGCRVFATLAEAHDELPDLLVRHCLQSNIQNANDYSCGKKDGEGSMCVFPVVASLSQGNIARDRLKLFEVVFRKALSILRKHDRHYIGSGNREVPLPNLLICPWYVVGCDFVRHPHIFYDMYLACSTPNTHMMPYFLRKDSAVLREVQRGIKCASWPPFGYYETIIRTALMHDRVDILRAIWLMADDDGADDDDEERMEMKQLKATMRSHYDSDLYGVLSWPVRAAQANAHACFDYLCGVGMHPKGIWDVVFHGSCDEHLFERVYEQFPTKDRLDIGAPACANVGVSVFGEIQRFVRRLRSFADKGGFDRVDCELHYHPNDNRFWMWYSDDGIYMASHPRSGQEAEQRRGRLYVSPEICRIADEADRTRE